MSTISSSFDKDAHARLKGIVKRIYEIPAFPQVIIRLGKVAEDPDSNSTDLAEVMDKDQALSAKVLRLVNSAFYSLASPVSSLRHAITLIGFNSIRSLAMSVSVRGMFPGDSDPIGQSAFWEHSLVVGSTCRVIAERNGLQEKDELFTAGLMHDIGILIARQHLLEEIKTVDEMVIDSGVTSISAEREVIGVDHTLLGSWLAEYWCLPSNLQAAIRYHHEAREANAPCLAELSPNLRQVAEIVSLADDLAGRLGYPRIPGTVVDLSDLPDHLKAYLRRVDLESLGHEIREHVVHVREFVTP